MDCECPALLGPVDALVATAEAARRYHDRSLAGERRFRVAEELALDGFGILEAVRDQRRAIVDFRWTYANPAMLKLLRVAGADLAGRRLLEHLPGHRNHPALFSNYVQVVESGEPSSAEAFYVADGLRGWFRIDAVRLDDGIALSLRDVTERKEREAARQESEDRFRLLADAVDDVFWITDVRQQRVVYVSPAYERVWGSQQSASIATRRSGGSMCIRWTVRGSTRSSIRCWRGAARPSS